MVARAPCAYRPEESLSTRQSRALVKPSPFTLSGNVVDVHINAQILLKFSGRVVQGVICNFNPLTKASCNTADT